MKTVAVESTVWVDVDDTLVMWGIKAKKGQKLVAITEPHSGNQVYLAPHIGHIKVLKDRKARGSFIVVWSSGGYAWAETVVRALGLEAYVDLCMTKPHLYMDDKDAVSVMGERLYIPYGDGYGQK